MTKPTRAEAVAKWNRSPPAEAEAGLDTLHKWSITQLFDLVAACGVFREEVPYCGGCEPTMPLPDSIDDGSEDDAAVERLREEPDGRRHREDVLTELLAAERTENARLTKAAHDNDTMWVRDRKATVRIGAELRAMTEERDAITDAASRAGWSSVETIPEFIARRAEASSKRAWTTADSVLRGINDAADEHGRRVGETIAKFIGRMAKEKDADTERLAAAMKERKAHQQAIEAADGNGRGELEDVGDFVERLASECFAAERRASEMKKNQQAAIDDACDEVRAEMWLAVDKVIGDGVCGAVKKGQVGQ